MKKKVHLQKEKKYHYTAIFYGFTNNQLSIWPNAICQQVYLDFSPWLCPLGLPSVTQKAVHETYDSYKSLGHLCLISFQQHHTPLFCVWQCSTDFFWVEIPHFSVEYHRG